MNEVLTYLNSLPEPQRSTLQKLRADLLDAVPEATEGISYGMPAIFLKGKPIAGYFAFKKHLGYFPHSSLTVSRLEPELQGFKRSKGGFQFPHDMPLDKALVEKLAAERILELKGQYPKLFT